MHSFAPHRHSSSGEASTKETKGLVLNQGWRYDLMEWFHDTFSFRGKFRELRQRTASLARLQPGDAVLDVGCGTGTLAMEVARRVGRAGRVAGVDPGTQQIARARLKAARRNVPIEFKIVVIEQLPFPDQTFDVVFSTLMMHHLPASLKRQGLAEIARVLKPGGRLVIADFNRKQERQGKAARFTPGGAAYKIWLPLTRTPVSQWWKRRRCGSHDSLLSQEQALSGLTKARTNGRSKSKRSPRSRGASTGSAMKAVSLCKANFSNNS
jgi:ubiquinone/menaquinone biosynthesis C-methylase UbiE